MNKNNWKNSSTNFIIGNVTDKMWNTDRKQRMSEDGKSILEILNNSDALKCRVSICATMYMYLQTLSDV